MSKVVKAIALIAVAVAVIVFAPVIAPVIAGALGAIGVTVATTAIVSALVGFGLSLALTGISALFRKTPTLNQSMTDRLQVMVAPTAPRKIVFGLSAAGQDVRFQEAYGAKQDRFATATILASHKVNAILSMYVEDKVAWNGAVLHAGIESYRGVTEGRSTNAQAMGSGTYWTNTSSVTGCAYQQIVWKLDQKVLPQGVPQKLITVVEGCPVYDPRRDSTRGGSGSHRINDQTTWEYRSGGVEIGRNPALAMLTYLLGWRINGKVVWGMGIDAINIDIENFKAYANVCEETVTMASGGGLQRYTIDAIFSTSDTHESILSAISACMGSCKMIDLAGTYQFVGGYDDVASPKQAFTAHDLKSSSGSAIPYQWVPAVSPKDTYNIVSGRFADPANLYQLNTWGTITTEPLADKIDRTLTLDFSGVSRGETCQRIAKQFLMREAKTPGMFTGTFGPRAFAVQVGSLCTLSLPDRGWNNKLFRVMAQAETHDLTFQMTLREESSEVYGWDREEKPIPFAPRPPGYDPADTLPVVGMTLNTEVINGVG